MTLYLNSVNLDFTSRIFAVYQIFFLKPDFFFSFLKLFSFSHQQTINSNIIILSLKRIFHTSFNWWFFLEVRVTGYFSTLWDADLKSLVLRMISFLLQIFSSSRFFFLQYFDDFSKGSNYICYHVSQLFQLSGKVRIFIYLFAFFYGL